MYKNFACKFYNGSMICSSFSVLLHSNRSLLVLICVVGRTESLRVHRWNYVEVQHSMDPSRVRPLVVTSHAKTDTLCTVFGPFQESHTVQFTFLNSFVFLYFVSMFSRFTNFISTGGGKFIAVGGIACAVSSTDGYHWTLVHFFPLVLIFVSSDSSSC